MTRYLVSLVVAATLLILIGCGGAPTGPASPLEMSAKDRLTELSELWSLAQLDLNRPPAKLQDLAKFNRAGGFAYRAVADGDVAVYWGAALGQGNAIVAYEKNAPTAGGWVLLQDRTVKQLSAQEFQSTAKAGK